MEHETLLPQQTKPNDYKKCSAIRYWMNSSTPSPKVVFYLSLLFEMAKVTNFILCMVLSYETMILMVILTIPVALIALVVGAYYVYRQYKIMKNADGILLACVTMFPLCVITVFIIATVSTGMSSIFSCGVWEGVQLILRQETRDPQKNNAPSVAYINALARYYFINSLDETGKFKRLLAMNYYLHSVFYKYTNNLQVPDDFVEIELDKICDLQSDGYKDQHIITDTVSWKDIMSRSHRKYGYRMLKLVKAIYLWSIIQCIVSMSYVIYTISDIDYRIVMMMISIVSYGIFEIINYKIVYSVIFKMGFYSCLILPHWSIQKIRYQASWDIVGTVDEMMKNIKKIHYIMFDQFKEIECLNEYVEEEDIRGIISQFIWDKLPTYENFYFFR